MPMDHSTFLTEHPELFQEHSYPSRCWALIREVREYERRQMDFNCPGSFDLTGGFAGDSVGSILFAAKVLVYEYAAHRAPRLRLIASRRGTVPYTLRVTLFMLLILCSKLQKSHIIGQEGQLEEIIDVFIGTSEAQQHFLRMVIEQASSYRAFSVAPTEASVSYFYTEIFCSLLNRTPEYLYPGAIDTMRAYFASLPVEPPVFKLGEPPFDEEVVYLGFELKPFNIPPQHSSFSLSWPQSYYRMVNVMTTPVSTQTSFELATPLQFRDEVANRPEQVRRPNAMGIMLTPLRPSRT